MLSRCRVYEAQRLGVQSLARKYLEAVLYEPAVFGIDCTLPDFRAVIARVVEQRVPDMVEVDPYLMGAPCLQAAFHHSDITEPFQHSVVGHGVFPAVSLGEHLEPHPVVGIPAYIAGDGALVLLEVAPDDCDIDPVYGVDEELPGKLELGFLVLGYN